MSDTPRVTPMAPPEPGMRVALSAVDVLAFVCEIFAFATLAIWGFAMWPFPWNIVVGIGAPVVELLVYVSATLAWWSMGLTWVGLVFAVVAVTAGVLAGRRRFA
jgi:uncharacterized RDD family membrane protein YckC